MGLMLRRMCMMGASAIPTPPLLKTVTGALLHITDALAKPAHKFTATLEPIQDLHGQANPYPAGGGKNKFDKDSLDSTTDYTYYYLGYFYSDPIILKPNTSYIMSPTSTETLSTNRYYVLFINNDVSDPDAVPSSNNNTFRYPVSAGVPASVTFTTGQTGAIRFGAYGLNTTTVDSDSLAAFMSINYQIEEGSTATTWSPYSNICPITGHTGASVVRTGKNVFDLDLSNFTVGIALPSDAVCADGTLSGTVNANERDKGVLFYNIPLKSGTYTISYDYVNAAGNKEWKPLIVSSGGDWYANDKMNIAAKDASGHVSKTITITEAYKISLTLNSFGVAANSGKNIISNLQIELSSTATTYEPYQGTTIPITFPAAAGTVYGCTLTHEDGEWKLAVDRAKTILDGSRVYSSFSDESVNTCRCFLNMYSEMLPNNATSTINIVSDSLTPYAPDYIYSNDVMGISENRNIESNGLWIRISKNLLSENTLDGMKAYLTSNPCEVVYYIKSEPIEYTLTESQALTLLKGENVVWCDNSDDLELQYYAKAEETP